MRCDLRRTVWFVVMISLVTACSSAALEEGGDTSQAGVSLPVIGSFDSADLQARAFTRGCRSHCLASESTPDVLKDALGQYTDQVEYLTTAEIDARFSDDGAGADGGSLIEVSAVRTTERRDVRAVDVSTSRGFGDFNRQTYLFLWNGSAWVNISPDAVGVTVTSAVS